MFQYIIVIKIKFDLKFYGSFQKKVFKKEKYKFYFNDTLYGIFKFEFIYVIIILCDFVIFRFKFIIFNKEIEF